MKTFLKVLKYTLIILGVIGAGCFLVFLVLGVYNSLFANDIITAQDRSKSAYMFVNMIVCAFISFGCLFPTVFIKEKIWLDHPIKHIKEMIENKNNKRE